MEIDSTPLYKEARSIMNDGATTANLGWKAVIHYGDEHYTPIQVLSVNFMRDYVDSFTDEVTVTVQIPLGIYARRIYPKRTELQITLKRVPLGEITNAVDGEIEIQSERYSALLIDGDRAPTVAQGAESNDEESLNLTQILDVDFQIYDKALEQLRVMQSGGVLRKTKVQDAILTVLTNQALQANVDGIRAVEGVDMVDADNTDIKNQIIITHGTKLIDVADFIHARIGVYSTGIGSYIQNKYWYIYPLYDTTQFNKRDKTLTILVMPKKKFSNIERTFRVIDDAVTILATGETGFKDDSGTFYVGGGNGVRFADAASMMDGTKTEGNKTKASRAANNSEFVFDAPVAGINHAPLTPERISANPFTAYSMLAARRGGMFKCVWQNSDHSLLIPGMTVKIIYSDKNEMQEIYGILHGAQSVSHKYSGIGTEKFNNQSVLSVFVNNQVTDIEA